MELEIVKILSCVVACGDDESLWREPTKYMRDKIIVLLVEYEEEDYE